MAMLEVPHHNADCDRFKTQNRFQGEFCVFSDVTHLFPMVGCVRSKLLFRTVQRNLKTFLLMQVYTWTEIHGLDLLDLFFEVLHSFLNQPKKPKEKVQGNLGCMAHNQEDTPRTKLRLQISTTILNCATLIMFLQT